MSSLEKCKDLLQEVINELRNTPEGRSSNEAPKIPSTAGGAGGDVPSSSSGASAPPPSRVNSSIHEEHRRLFGYNPRFNPYNRSTRRSGQKRAVKAGPKKVQTWTRQFVCLAKREQTSPPQLWEYSRLQAAGLGQKKITLDLDDTPLDVDLKLKEAFPKLEDAGGYCMMRTGQGARTLMVISGPYSTETIKDFMGQGKVFIRPLQKDLSMDAVESTTLVRFAVIFVMHFFLFHHAVMLSCQKREKLGEKQSKGKGGGVRPMLMNNLPVIGYPCYAQRTLTSPLLYGEKHSTSKTRDFGAVSTLFLAVEC